MWMWLSNKQPVAVVAVDDDDLGQRGHAGLGHVLLEGFWWFILNLYIVLWYLGLGLGVWMGMGWRERD